MPKRFIVTNFAYGTGPYLRTTELALAFNDELEKRGKERLGIIVPLVYGEKQKKIMAEEFAKDEIVFDKKLGAILKSIFYGDNIYEEVLKKWSQNAKEISKTAQDYLARTYGDSIVLELNRSPRIRYDIAPAYFTTFGYVAEILENVKSVSKEAVAVDRALLEKGIEAANWVESAAKIHAVAYPATFSWSEGYKARYKNEIVTPPITRQYERNIERFKPGFFVTITGIPGLERLYQEAKVLGINIYSNDTKVVAGSTWRLPHAIPNKNTIFQFARSGWSSVWLSMMSGTPLVVPNFDPKDDPEIYFNNLAVEKLGIGIVYRGQPLGEILNEVPRLKANSQKLCDEIRSRWPGEPDPLDGNRYCAKLFAEDFLKNS